MQQTLRYFFAAMSVFALAVCLAGAARAEDDATAFANAHGAQAGMSRLKSQDDPDEPQFIGACTLRDAFLNRMMMVESAGVLDAKNPRSSALGPFQFVSDTFIDVSRRNFPGEVSDLSDRQLLALRTDYGFSRKVADAYSQENADFLRDMGLTANPGNLRLAFFSGASGAARVLSASPKTPLSHVLSAGAIAANPFLAAMTAGDLIDRSSREVGLQSLQKVYPRGKKRPASDLPTIRVRCNLGRASCQKWLYLKKKRMGLASRKVRIIH